MGKVRQDIKFFKKRSGRADAAPSRIPVPLPRASTLVNFGQTGLPLAAETGQGEPSIGGGGGRIGSGDCLGSVFYHHSDHHFLFDSGFGDVSER